MNKTKIQICKRVLVVIPSIMLGILAAAVLIRLVPITSFAEEADQKVVRVGWHEEPYFITDENGRKSGYYNMPGIKKMFKSWNEANGKDKLRLRMRWF